MPLVKALKTLKGGQVTDVPSHEQSFEAFQVVQNCIPTAEGLKPLQSLCDAVGPTINAIVANAVGFPVTVVDDIGYMWTNNGTLGCSLYDTGLISFSTDNHATPQAPLVLANNTATVTAWNALTAPEQIAVMLKNMIIPYGDNIIFNHDITRLASGRLIDNTAKHVYNPTTLATSLMLDSDGSVNGWAPVPQKYLVHDEYLLSIGGADGFEHNSTQTTGAQLITDTVILMPSTLNMVNGDFIGIKLDNSTWHWTTVVSFVPNVSATITAGLPSAIAAAGNLIFYATKAVVEHRGYMRWNHPAAIDRWHPSTVTPVDSLAGWKQHMSRAGFVDAFIFNDVVYVLTEDNIHRFTKIGGEIGYNMKSLSVHPKIGVGAIHSVVTTSMATYILTLEGLYSFNGQFLTPVSAGQTEDLFSKLWLKEHLSDTLYQEGGIIQSIQVGLHVPVIDCIFWFVTYGVGAAVNNFILVYNYETQRASYLLPPLTEIWYPMHGSSAGIAVYDRAAGTTRCFALRPKTSATIPPNAEIVLDSGFLSTEDTSQFMTINRVFLEFPTTNVSDVLSGLTVSAKGYDQKGILHATVSYGLIGDSYARGFLDERISGRFVSFQFQGFPNNWTNWAVDLNGSGAALRAIGVKAKPRGRRS